MKKIQQTMCVAIKRWTSYEIKAITVIMDNLKPKTNKQIPRLANIGGNRTKFCVLCSEIVSFHLPCWNRNAAPLRISIGVNIMNYSARIPHKHNKANDKEVYSFFVGGFTHLLSFIDKSSKSWKLKVQHPKPKCWTKQNIFRFHSLYLDFSLK